MFDYASEYALLKEEYPYIEAKELDDAYIFCGKVILNADYDNIPLYDEYCVEIIVNKDFPESIPVIKELDNNVPKAFEHCNSDGTLCLGANCELLDYLEKDSHLVSFVKHFLTSFLYSASYYKRYQCAPPFGERSHGLKGIKEAYFERYGVTKETDLMTCLMYIVGKATFRGHSRCFCKSGKKLRDCHGAKILEDIKSKNIKKYQYDAYRLLIDYYQKNTPSTGG